MNHYSLVENTGHISFACVSYNTSDIEIIKTYGINFYKKLHTVPLWLSYVMLYSEYRMKQNFV